MDGLTQSEIDYLQAAAAEAHRDVMIEDEGYTVCECWKDGCHARGSANAYAEYIQETRRLGVYETIFILQDCQKALLTIDNVVLRGNGWLAVRGPV